MLPLDLVQSQGVLHVDSSLRNFARPMSRPLVPFRQRMVSSSSISMKLEIRSSQISLSFTLLDAISMVMAVMALSTVFMGVHFTLMLLPILSMWNARPVWKQARQSWGKQSLNKCAGILQVLLSRTSTVTTAFMMQVCFVMTASPRINPKPSLGLVQSIKTRLLNITFRPFVLGAPHDGACSRTLAKPLQHTSLAICSPTCHLVVQLHP
jgi:hypothetical protein